MKLSIPTTTFAMVVVSAATTLVLSSNITPVAMATTTETSNTERHSRYTIRHRGLGIRYSGDMVAEAASKQRVLLDVDTDGDEVRRFLAVGYGSMSFVDVEEASVQRSSIIGGKDKGKSAKKDRGKDKSKSNDKKARARGKDAEKKKRDEDKSSTKKIDKLTKSDGVSIHDGDDEQRALGVGYSGDVAEEARVEGRLSRTGKDKGKSGAKKTRGKSGSKKEKKWTARDENKIALPEKPVSRTGKDKGAPSRKIGGSGDISSRSGGKDKRASKEGTGKAVVEASEDNRKIVGSGDIASRSGGKAKRASKGGTDKAIDKASEGKSGSGDVEEVSRTGGKSKGAVATKKYTVRHRVLGVGYGGESSGVVEEAQEQLISRNGKDKGKSGAKREKRNHHSKKKSAYKATKDEDDASAPMKWKSHRRATGAGCSRGQGENGKNSSNGRGKDSGKDASSGNGKDGSNARGKEGSKDARGGYGKFGRDRGRRRTESGVFACHYSGSFTCCQEYGNSGDEPLCCKGDYVEDDSDRERPVNDNTGDDGHDGPAVFIAQAIASDNNDNVSHSNDYP